MANSRKSMLEEFRKDLDYMVQLASLIDQKYSDNDNETYHYLKKLRRLTDKFNHKYPLLKAVVKKTFLNIFLKFMIRKESVDEVFDNFVSSISSLNREKADITYLPNLDNTYSNQIKDTLALKRDVSWNMVEVIYRSESLCFTNSPEFNLLAFYAMSDYRKGLDLRKNNDTFCFDFDPKNHNGQGLVYSEKKIFSEINY
ncbi:hypothetical protein JXC34_04380 [Candidatus Woesearchaeota archaeon]|nr:hypothetical protein [Candidatus Woesearchaeota archaeon]